jgi:hypothetical protein
LYFTSPLNIKLAISEEEESVAKRGFSLDGFAAVAKCSVVAYRFKEMKKKSKNFIELIVMLDHLL